MTVKSPNKGDLKFLYKYSNQLNLMSRIAEALAKIMRKAGFNIIDSELNKNFEVVDYSSGRKVSIKINEGDKSEI